MKFAYINNTSVDVTAYHFAIMAAIAAGGVFGEDFADIFSLDCPAGEWVLSMVEP